MNIQRPIIWLICLICVCAHPFVYGDKQKVAVIGGGGSGLTSAYLLDQEFDVTLFEVQDRLGGHANTVEVNAGGTLVPIEAGFEFICENQFPHFYHLLNDILKVDLHPYTLTTTFYRTDGSHVLELPPVHDGQVEFRSLGLDNIFKMVEFDLLLEEGKKIVNAQNMGITFEDFANQLLLSTDFKNEFLYPYLAAGWGVSKDDIKQFAAYDALKYVIKGEEARHYQWIEIVGGTKQYIQALASQLENATVKLSTNITKITFENNLYTIVEENGNQSEFEHLVIATNAQQAAELLKDISFAQDIKMMLSQIEYYKTTIAIHGDNRFMPPKSEDWRVVNVRYDGENSETTVYKNWLSPHAPIFKSWITYDVRPSQDTGTPMPEPLYAIAHYDHPKANLKYFETQKAISAIQGNYNLFFAGNYTFDNDSHESAIMSAIKVAKQLVPDSERLKNLEIH